MFHGKISQAQHITAMSDVSHTKIREQLETLLLHDVPFCYDW